MAAVNTDSAKALIGTDALKRRYIQENSGGDKEIVLAVEGISCAGCIPGLEAKIRTITGVKTAAINHSNYRASIVWDPARISSELLLDRIQGFGYGIRPYQALEQERVINDEKKQSLTRLFIALAFGMQVMMITVALYLGDAMGMEERHRHALRYAAMLMTLPVLLISARPFFENAWKGIRRYALNVDVPVSLALILAYGGSVLATLGYQGQVYFESVVMFVVLLLSARYLETVARHKGIEAISDMEKSVPEVATRIDHNGNRILVDIVELKPGDRVIVGPGDLVPVDGRVCHGESSVNESIITGESLPVLKRSGDFVIAGSANFQNPLTIEVRKPATDSVVNNLVKITTQAQHGKSRVSRLADKLAAQFVWGVLITALFAGAYWWFLDRDLWLPVVISTLVVACPCALSLATPTAFVAAMSNLTRRGILPVKSDFLDRLPEVNHIIFDKTGTLTTGKFSVSRIETVPQISQARAIAIAKALNKDSKHPLSQGLANLETDLSYVGQQIDHRHGGGVSGFIEGARWALGSERFVADIAGLEQMQVPWQQPSSPSSVCFLACNQQIMAKFELVDTIRPEAKSVIDKLKNKQIALSVYSGDSEAAVESVAASLGIDDYQGALLPEEKLQLARALISQGKSVAVVGDGLNDAPLMAAASVSVAMGHGADLSKITSDVVLTHDNLSGLISTFDVGEKTTGVIKQNYIWAAAYNLLAIPAAIFGLVPPWVAALGMSASSLIVSVNALRLLKRSDKTDNALTTDRQNHSVLAG